MILTKAEIDAIALEVVSNPLYKDEPIESLAVLMVEAGAEAVLDKLRRSGSRIQVACYKPGWWVFIPDSEVKDDAERKQGGNPAAKEGAADRHAPADGG